MSAHQTYLITCDAIGCTEVKAPELGERTTFDVRRRLHGGGWRHVLHQISASGVTPSIDLCPEHAHLVDNEAELATIAGYYAKGGAGHDERRAKRRR